MSNAEVAEQFEEIADRLLLEGDSWFKVSAYRRAAESLRGMEQPVEAIAARNALRKVPGVGDAIRAKIEAFLETGHIPLLDRLRSEQAPGLLALMRETALPPRRVRALAAGPLHVESIDRLRELLADGDLERSGSLDAAGLRTVRDWADRPAGSLKDA